MKDALGCGNQLLFGDISPGDTLVFGEFVHLHINANHIAAFARNNQQAALAGRLDQRLETDIREVGIDQYIHHAPGVVGGLPLKRQPHGLTHVTARAVTAEHISGADGF